MIAVYNTRGRELLARGYDSPESLDVSAPAMGDTLSVTTACNSTRLVRLERSPGGGRAFYGADREPLCEDLGDLRSYRAATPEEYDAFEAERLAQNLADVVEKFGAPRLGSLLRVVKCERDNTICDVASVLRDRNRDGLASQALAFRYLDANGVEA